MKPLYTIEGGVPGVRYAEPRDEPQLFQLLCMLHEENAFFSMNPTKVKEGIRIGTERNLGLIFVIEEKRIIVATLGMVLASDWYSDDYFWLERWNFVHPDHRQGTQHARKLIEQAKWLSDWFKTQGRPIPVQVGINSLDRTRAKIRLYARHMPCIGAYFMWGSPPINAEKMRAAQNEVDKESQISGHDRSRVLHVHPNAETALQVSAK